MVWFRSLKYLVATVDVQLLLSLIKTVIERLIGNPLILQQHAFFVIMLCLMKVVR